MAMTESERKARRRTKNAQYQAAYRKRQHEKGLIQVPAYVSLESRPDLWVLQRALMLNPRLIFDATLGSLRDPRTGRLTSPQRVVERARDAAPSPRRDTKGG